MAGDVEPLDGYMDFIIHSDGEIFLTDEDTWDVLSPRQLADIIREDPTWDGYTPIRLLACEAGKYDNGAAKQLARELGVNILTTDGYVLLSEKGIYILYDDDYHQNEMELSNPEQLEEAYNNDDYRLSDDFQDGRWFEVDPY